MSKVNVVSGLFSLLLLAGCGGGDTYKGEKVPTVPYSGEVKIDGSPIASGTIEFLPAGGNEKARISSSMINSGKFSAGTYGKSDGIIPGKYKVSLAADATATTPLPAVEDMEVTIDDSGNESAVIELKSKGGAVEADPLLNPKNAP